MLALSHTGRLGDEMFRYAQKPGVDLFYTPEEQRDFGSYEQESRLFLELGQVNQAERCAYEALATSGEDPATLETLAMIHVVKGQPGTARVFLHALARIPFHRTTAEAILRRLEVDPRLEDDPRAFAIRANMAEKDTVASETNVDEMLQILLDKNPHNKMAFELLMAHYLTSRRLDDVVANLPRLPDFSLRRVPRHYQEARVIQADLPGGSRPLGEREIDPAVLERAQEFERIRTHAANLANAVDSAVAAGLADSYFFYYAYGVSGR
jgi:hypothetical protein